MKSRKFHFSKPCCELMRHALLATLLLHLWSSAVTAESPREQLLRGIVFLEEGDLASALRVLPPLMNHKEWQPPERYQLHGALGYAYQATGDPERAATHLRAARKLTGSVEDTMNVGLLLAETHLAMQDPIGALSALDRLPAPRRESEAARLLLSTAHAMAGKTTLAEELLERLLERGESLDALRAVAVLEYERGLFREAEQHFARARKLEPHDYYTAVYHARVLLELGSSGPAKEELRRLTPSTPEVEYLQGLAALRERDFTRAATGFRRALDGNPDYAEALFGLGTALRRQGKSDEARATYARFQEIERGWVAYRRRRDALLEVAKGAPDDDDAHASVATCAAGQNDLETAEASFWRALTLAPRNSQYRIGLAQTLRKMRRYQAALVQYRRALELSPGHPTARREIEELLRQARLAGKSARSPR